jgi:hypothetical protein
MELVKETSDFLLVSLFSNFFEFLSLWLPKAFGPKGEC